MKISQHEALDAWQGRDPWLRSRFPSHQQASPINSLNQRLLPGFQREPSLPTDVLSNLARAVGWVESERCSGRSRLAGSEPLWRRGLGPRRSSLQWCSTHNMCRICYGQPGMEAMSLVFRKSW